jgi:eukaryotic-like serine/threonine-protein kinase
MESAGPGRLIAGRYRLSTVIGRGGMGVVWQARDELLGRDVALKELVSPAYFSEEEQQAACRRATREAKVAARVSHRNVIRVFDIIEEDGCPWIVMELLPPRSLRDLVKEEGPLGPVQAAEVGLGILAALRAAHAEGIVHRDVKPANILMAPDRVVLTDFGIARAAGTSALTSVGVLIGSPSYIAPERARGGQSGPPADLWGLGASLYAAVEGHGPFDRDGDALASLTAAVADEPEPATHAGPLLWPVIAGLLRKDPDERLDAAEAERMLRRAAAPPAVPVSAVTPRPRRSQALAVALVGSALVALTASAAAVLALTSPPRHQMAPAAAVAPSVAASTLPPAASIHYPTASNHPKTSAETHLTARTWQPQAPGSPSTENAGHGAVPQNWLAVRTGSFVFYISDPEWRTHGSHRTVRPFGAEHGRVNDRGGDQQKALAGRHGGRHQK